MELDLELSLSPQTNSSKLWFHFDLNKHDVADSIAPRLENKKETLVLRNIEEDCYTHKPRLFSLNDQPNDKDIDPSESDSTIIYNEEENDEVVEWPPIKSYMSKYHNYHHHSHNHPYRHHGRRITPLLNNNLSNDPTVTMERVGSSSSTSLRSSMYVKVKMDGVAITRKVNIKLFNSYESFTNSLITMFSQYEGCDKEDTNYTFTFQGKDGEWLQPQDVPWKVFAEYVHRVSIIKDRSCAYTRCLF